MIVDDDDPVHLVGDPRRPLRKTRIRVIGDNARTGVGRRRCRHFEDPPLITLAIVAGLAHPDFLLEVEAVAVVPEE